MLHPCHEVAEKFQRVFRFLVVVAGLSQFRHGNVEDFGELGSDPVGRLLPFEQVLVEAATCGLRIRRTPCRGEPADADVALRHLLSEGFCKCHVPVIKAQCRFVKGTVPNRVGTLHRRVPAGTMRGTVPTALADHLLPAAQRKFPPSTPNRGYLGFNLTHFAKAVASRTGGKVESEARSIRKIWENDQWPRDAKLRHITAALGIKFGDLPPRPDSQRAAKLDEGALRARIVLKEALEAVRDTRPRDAEQILSDALRWFDDYHAEQSPPQSVPGNS